MLHSLSLFRALNATVVSPDNLFWDYFLLGEKLLNAPSVFNFYSPTSHSASTTACRSWTCCAARARWPPC
jgi:hypothetical protein